MNEYISSEKEGRYCTPKDTPLYFGSYLNTAVHNVFILINHLTEKFGYLGYLPINKDKDVQSRQSRKHILAHIFDRNNTISDVDKIRVYRYLVKRHHLPFLKVFDGEMVYAATTVKENSGDKQKETSSNDNTIELKGVDFEGLHHFITSALDLLVKLRNAYTHYLAVDGDGKQVERERFRMDEQMMTSLNTMFELAPYFSFLRHQEKQTVSNYDHLQHYNIIDVNSHQLCEHGLYFFINLFLERAQAIKFLKRISGFKNETTPNFKATIQSFVSYALKVPDLRLENENPLQSLQMEILSELNRCPKELFKHLTEEGKKVFEPQMDQESQMQVLWNSVNSDAMDDKTVDNLLRELTSFKRHSDRFPYFALRYIEEMELFNEIRFQITLGKLIVNRYDKELTGDRRVLKTINCFGKLRDFEGKEAEILKKLKETAPDKELVQFEQFAPHYNMNNNKVAFYIFDEKESNKIRYPSVFDSNEDMSPTGFISINELPKLLTLAVLIGEKQAEKEITSFVKEKDPLLLLTKDKIDEIRENANYIPAKLTKRSINEKVLKSEKGKTAYLNNKVEEKLLKKLNISKDELLKLDKEAFCKKNKNKNKKDIEHFSQIKYCYYYELRREELKKHLPKDVKLSTLPEKLKDYLMSIEDVDSKKVIHKKIKAIKDEATQLKKEIEKLDCSLKLGEIATFIAWDMINMVVCKGVKDKITSPYYNYLQNKIAYFSTHKKEIIAVCKELNLFDNTIGHVFLNQAIINKSGGVKEFAINYLDAKAAWIETELFKSGKTGGFFIPQGKPIPLKIKKLASKDFSIETWLVRRKKMPVNLPRTLFDTQIERVLKSRVRKGGREVLETDKFTILLGKYLGGDSQPFYQWERRYRVNKEDVLFDITGQDSRALRVKGKHIEQNEKAIRFTQTKDRVLRLMCEKILEKESSDNKSANQLPLINMIPGNARNPLDRPAVFQQKIIKKGDESYCIIIAKDNEQQKDEVAQYQSLQTEADRESYQKQKGYEWTIKDFGRFRRFVKDRRIPNLVTYFESKEIPFALLEYQLKEYDKYREQVFEKIFELETAVVEKDQEGLIKIELAEGDKSFEEVQFRTYVRWMKENNIIADESRSLPTVTGCRNKFSHSEFPEQINGIEKITQEQINDFEQNHRNKGYKEKANISIAKHIFEKFNQEVERLKRELRS